MGVENFAAFLVTAFIFVITPGMDTLFVLNKSLGQGRKSGVYAGLGINTGVLIHTLVAAVGLSVFIAKSPIGFQLIKYIGAIYIFYLGVMTFKSKETVLKEEDGNQVQTVQKASFFSGFLTNALNPKVALFFMAFFPQFINQNELDNPVPFIVLGLTYAGIGIVWLLILAVFASKFSLSIRKNQKIENKINKICGMIFIAMAIFMAMV